MLFCLLFVISDDEGDVVDDDEEEEEEKKPKTVKQNVTEWEHLNDNKVGPPDSFVVITACISCLCPCRKTYNNNNLYCIVIAFTASSSTPQINFQTQVWTKSGRTKRDKLTTEYCASRMLQSGNTSTTIKSVQVTH